MNYIGNVIRPPSEANAIILQVTVGCSYNKCTFCGAYKESKENKESQFRIKSEKTVEADLEFARKYYRDKNRVFLADGDVLILSHNRLVRIFEKIREYLPWVKRISLYGNAKAIRSKTAFQLQDLSQRGLERVYMGLESGCNEILHQVKKGETAATMIAAGQRIREAGIFLSVTVLLGLGGVKLSQRHAVDTAAVLSSMAPRQIAALTLMPLPNTELGEAVQNGTFTLPSPQEILNELQLLISHLKDVRCQFHANHASSYLPLAGRLPKDKERLLAAIELAIKGTTPIVPEYWRAL